MEQHSFYSKLEKLFEQRAISSYAACAGIREIVIQELLETLKDLQTIIYQTDKLLETQRVLDTHTAFQITEYRKQIENRVISMVNDDEQRASDLLKRLGAFLQMEMQMREGVSPTTLPLDSFYGLKICDVHLQRELINYKSPKELPAKLWMALEQYDKLGEVIDDLEDIDEDMDAINSNRFLIQAGEMGLQSTKADYIVYIDQLLKEMIPCEEALKTLLGPKALSPKVLAAYAMKLTHSCSLPPHKVPLITKLLAEKEI